MFGQEALVGCGKQTMLMRGWHHPNVIHSFKGQVFSKGLQRARFTLTTSTDMIHVRQAFHVTSEPDEAEL